MADASRHTVVIDDPLSMWAKLAWDIEIFREVQASYPDEAQPLAYAAINACIAAKSLYDFVVTATKSLKRKQKIPIDDVAFAVDLANAIPGQAICSAIANTAKHGIIDEGKWHGGRVELHYREGDEDCPPGFVVYHVSGQQDSAALAMKTFTDLLDNWWSYLELHGFTNGENRVPEWQQNKLRRMFGSR